MLSLKNLLKPIVTKAPINEVYNYLWWEGLYTLPDKNLIRVKYAIENYIRVEETNVTR
jgi:hypothetical protein